MAILMISGCSGSFTHRPGQDQAMKMVWNDFYGMTSDPPEVEWISNEGWKIAGDYYMGFTWAGWKIQVACGNWCERPISDGIFAHELMHERTFERTGDVDTFHYRGDWHLVDPANLALYRASL